MLYLYVESEEYKNGERVHTKKKTSIKKLKLKNENETKTDRRTFYIYLYVQW